MLDLPSSPTTLNVTSDRFRNGVKLSVSGEIDLATVPILDAELYKAEAAGDVVIDLSGVTFLGAIAIRTFLLCSQEWRARGQTFEICELRPHHRRLLDRLGILDELTTPRRDDDRRSTHPDGD